MDSQPLVRITRLETSIQGTFGILEVDDFKCYTGELPYRDNEKSFSCIPIGKYNCQWTFSPRFQKYMYMVCMVPNRSGIRFHSANLMGDVKLGLRSQLNGCIALGDGLGLIEGQKSLLLSKTAIRKFEFHMAKRDFVLEIIEGFTGVRNSLS